MGKYRRDRINEEMAKEMSILLSQVKDPRVSGHMISVLRTEVTPDLKYAKVYLSFYTDDKAKQKESLDIISKANGFIRNQLKDRVQMRLLPELHFVVDDSIQYGMKIDKILKELNIEPVSDDNDGENK